jgi:4-hydroxybenzoate polyprenyltransferase
VFLFLSLAFVKRYAELLDLQDSRTAHGRGYHTSDLPLIHTMGVAAGYVSVLVLALYVNSPEVQVLYQNPKLIWAAVPVILFWISWIWMQTDRGNMHDDPLVFAVTDRTSLFCAAIFIVVIVAGATGIPW